MAESLSTNRPVFGVIGDAAADQGHALEKFLGILATHLDGEEGWIEFRESGLTWFPTRLATRLVGDSSRNPSPLKADIEIIRGVVSPSAEVMRRINDLNVHAAGWCYWFDDQSQSIRSTMRCSIEQRSWWWWWLLLEQLSAQATAADAVADELAVMAGGEVASQIHPQLGMRPTADGWILRTRTGPIEPVAPLGVFMSLFDVFQLNSAVQGLVESVEFSVDASADVTGVSDDRILHQAQSAWHPEIGWGRRFTTRDLEFNSGIDTEGGDFVGSLDEAMRRNREIALDSEAVPLFGAWVVVGSGYLVHNTFVPGGVLERLAIDATTTFGNVLAIMTLQTTQLAANRFAEIVTLGRNSEVDDAVGSAIDVMHIAAGPIGWSNIVDSALQPLYGSIPESERQLLLVPAIPAVTFGIFNPSGSSIGSLDFASVGRSWKLFLTLRHPFLPRRDLLGEWPIEQFEEMARFAGSFISEMDQGPQHWSLPEWVAVNHPEFTQPVFDGLRALAERQGANVDLESVADALWRGFDDPWSRMQTTAGEIEVDERSDDPVWWWIETVTSDEALCSAQLYMRSFWEAARQLARGDEQVAIGSLNPLISSIRDRLMADRDFRLSISPDEESFTPVLESSTGAYQRLSTND